MVELKGTNLNQLFDTLAQWNEVLEPILEDGFPSLEA